MTLTAYGKERINDGPDPAQECTDWTVVTLLDAGGVFARIPVAVTRATAQLILTGEWTNGGAVRTITGAEVSDGVGVCAEESGLSIPLEAYRGLELTVYINITSS